jgi:two-component system CheB/CheR fusion protein
VVDAVGVLVMANEEADALLGVGQSDVGQRLQDLEISYRPIDLRSPMDEALARRTPVHINGVQRALPGDRIEYLDVVVVPMRDGGDTHLGYTVSFTDVSSFHELHAEVARSRRRLETANEALQATNEELETTNEELQSTVEELETTNEELHSANEELETMNEELESANRELQMMNTEVRGHSDEVGRVNAFVESMLTSLRVGVVAVDSDLRVTAWNGRSPDLWGLRAEEVLGRAFATLDIGLPVEELERPIRQCLSGEPPRVERVVEALTRRGRMISCRVTITAALGPPGSREGAVLLVEEIAGSN